MWEAAQRGDVGDIRYLATYGTLRGARRRVLNQALAVAVRNDHDGAVAALLDLRANVDGIQDGFAPLHRAAICNSVGAAIILLRARAALDVRGPECPYTPVMYAACVRNRAVFDVLTGSCPLALMYAERQWFAGQEHAGGVARRRFLSPLRTIAPPAKKNNSDHAA